MLVFKLIFIFFLIQICATEFAPAASVSKNFKTLNNATTKSNVNGTISSQKRKFAFRFRLPFMDMEIENRRNLHMMHERLEKQQIFALHGNELYQMFVSRDEKRLSLVGGLSGGVKDIEPLGAEIIKWRDYFILVIAMEEYLEVYQLSEKVLEARASATKDIKCINETGPTFEPIQQLSLPGIYRKHFLIDTNKEQEQIVLAVGINFTKLYGRLHTFLWSNTYFEPIEEVTVPPIHVLYVIGTYPKYLLRGRVIKHQKKTIVTVYEFQSPDMTLSKTQTITANSRTIHASTYRSKNYLIACAAQQKQCNSFRMGSDGLFSLYKHRPSKELAFDKFIGGSHFLVATHQDQVMVYTSGRLDCYAGFTSNHTDVNSIFPLLNRHGEDFIILNYKRPFHTLVRMIEMESESGGILGTATFNTTEIEDTSILFQHRHMFEESIGQLRSLLLLRRNAMNSFWKLDVKNKTTPKEVRVSYPMRINAGKIGIVNLIGENLRSPMQLLQRVAQLRQKYITMRFRREIKDEVSSSKKRLKVKHLKVSNLNYAGNVINGFYMDSLAQPLPILSVRPKLTTKRLFTQQLLIRMRGTRPPRELSTENGTLPALKFRELNVDRINGVPWQSFYDSLFLKNGENKIKGRLILQDEANITLLFTPSLDGLEVDKLFNLVAPQVIESDIFFAGFMTTDLRVETMNGLEFENDLVFQDSDSFVETPVKFEHLRISEDLYFNDSRTDERVPNGEETEFKQYYTGNVVINGSLTIRNLLKEPDGNAEILVDGISLSKSDFKEEYLLINETQSINSTIVFDNARVTIRSLKTKFLNDHPTEEHLLADQPIEIKKPLLLIFMNARIHGNLESKPYSTKLLNISRNAIRQGDVANITGMKYFETPLEIDHVMTLSLNELPVSDLVLKSQLPSGLKFRNSKSFDRVEVANVAVVNKTLNSTYLNKLPLGELLNYDYHFKQLEVPHKLKAENIVFHEINGISFNEVFNNFKLRNGKLVLHKELIIEGNVKFGENLQVKYINELNWHDYQADLVRVNEHALITGEKCFQQELTITNTLSTTQLNELELEQIFTQILSKSRPQTITGAYTFGNLELSNLDVSAVNDVNSREFIDMRAGNLTIDGDICIPKITVLGNVDYNGDAMSEFQDFAENIAQLPNQKWRNIVVTGNAHWNDSTNTDKSYDNILNYLYKNAVQQTGKQVISGNVKLKNPIIRHMKTNYGFPKNIDIDFLVQDCVLKNSNATQIITAPKTFLDQVRIRDVEAKQFLGAYVVNDVDIQRFNDSLYYLSSDKPIVGPLHFKKSPIIGHMIVREKINGIEPRMIYHNVTQKLPPLITKHLNIAEDLEIGNVNDQSFNYFLRNRVPRHGVEIVDIPGVLTFENLVLKAESTIQTINDIQVDKIVFKRSNHLQAITGTKIFERNLILAGPAHVRQLNGEDLIETYQESVFRNRDYYFDNLNLVDANFEKGLIVTKALEPVVGSARDVTRNQAGKSFMYKSINKKIEKLSESLIARKQKSPLQLLYLDYATRTQVLWQSPNVSTHKIHQHELSRPSLCMRQYLNVELSNSDLIFLSNTSTTFITAHAHNLSVKAENFCEHKYRKVKSKITVTGANFTKVIGLKKYMESIAIYSPNNGEDIFLLLHALEFSQNRHEVRVLKISALHPENMTDWQSLTLGIGRQLRLFSNANYTALISGVGVVDKHPVLSIHHFNDSAQKFELAQIIDGDFDVFEIVFTTPPLELQLMLSCHHCRSVYIYNYNCTDLDTPYQMLQIIKLKTHIDRLKSFGLGGSAPYVLFLAEHGKHYFYLYRYTQLQGWIHTTHGYFGSTEIAVPLIDNTQEIGRNDLLILLCGSNNCNLVKVVGV